MRIVIYRNRIEDSEACTEGLLTIDGRFYCYTLELPWNNNVRNISCIPEGEYNVKVMKSEHFSLKMGHAVYLPQVLGVPNRDGILIHGANTVNDLLGCIGVGSAYNGPGRISKSVSDEFSKIVIANSKNLILSIMRAK